MTSLPIINGKSIIRKEFWTKLDRVGYAYTIKTVFGFNITETSMQIDSSKNENVPMCKNAAKSKAYSKLHEFIRFHDALTEYKSDILQEAATKRAIDAIDAKKKPFSKKSEINKKPDFLIKEVPTQISDIKVAGKKFKITDDFDLGDLLTKILRYCLKKAGIKGKAKIVFEKNYTPDYEVSFKSFKKKYTIMPCLHTTYLIQNEINKVLKDIQSYVRSEKQAGVEERQTRET